jgi:hypothetical protein
VREFGFRTGALSVIRDVDVVPGTGRGSRVPWWMWGLVAYLSLLFAAALWAAVVRTRSAQQRTTPRLADPEPFGD